MFLGSAPRRTATHLLNPIVLTPFLKPLWQALVFSHVPGDLSTFGRSTLTPVGPKKKGKSLNRLLSLGGKHNLAGP